jgi:hypothetical protein
MSSARLGMQFAVLVLKKAPFICRVVAYTRFTPRLTSIHFEDTLVSPTETCTCASTHEIKLRGEISGPHNDKFEDGCLLGFCAV